MRKSKSANDQIEVKDSKALLRELHAGLNMRSRPEDVAKAAKTILGDQLSPKEMGILNKAANSSSCSYMKDDFAKPVDMSRQLKVAADLFSLIRTPSPLDVAGIEEFIKVAGSTIGKRFGKSSFKSDRFNRYQRLDFNLDISKRQYNKKFRFLRHSEEKLKRLSSEIRKRFLTLASKSRLASTIELQEFIQDENVACFVAYYTARCNLRSVFAVKHQERPYDDIADMLFKRCNPSKTGWMTIAKVHPVQEVLVKLSDRQKGTLLGRYFKIIEDLAGLMKQIWDKSNVNRQSMIVQRGNDSTTWNIMAGAWNKSRDAWINLLHSMDMTDVLEKFLPGKALRLMAADVAYMHRSYGDGLEPDTAVWNELPLPWEVVLENATCNRQMIVDACKKVGMDAEKKGWVQPRPKSVAAFTPTPELVHGVVVSCPEFAAILRKAGVFSGQTAKPVDVSLHESIDEARQDAHDRFVAPVKVKKGTKKK